MSNHLYDEPVVSRMGTAGANLKETARGKSQMKRIREESELSESVTNFTNAVTSYHWKLGIRPGTLRKMKPLWKGGTT